MNSEISNPKVDVPANTDMNDLNILTDILSCIKHMVSGYALAMNEASNDTLYEIIKGVFEDSTAIQRDLFDIMFENGWYIVEVADQNKITQKYNQYNNQMSEMV